MDELTLLKNMADRVPPPTDDDLAPARALLRTEISATARRSRRRPWVSGAAVVGLAAAVTGVVALGALEPPRADAVEILHDAADAARALPDIPPRPDQFVYTRTKLPNGSVRETWLSADGVRDGLIVDRGETVVPGCRDGRRAVYHGPALLPDQTEPCMPKPAYDRALPTDAPAMRAYLIERNGPESDPQFGNSLGKDVAGLVNEEYVRPDSLAALFEAIGTFDELEVVENVTDGAGRPGIGVRFTFGGFQNTWVFDANTHVYLGTEGIDAVVEKAVVDEVRQRP